MMKPVALEKAEIEHQSNGLIIVHALFGKRSILESIKTHKNIEEYMQSVDLAGIYQSNHN